MVVHKFWLTKIYYIMYFVISGEETKIENVLAKINNYKYSNFLNATPSNGFFDIFKN